MKCITLEYPDGTVAIRGGVGPRMLKRFDGDLDAALTWILENRVPVDNPGATARIEDIEFPPDKEFREAWKRGNGKIEVDIAKARIIFDKRIRQAKLAKARELRDREDIGEDVTAERNQLRAINPDSRTANMPEELKAMWPTALRKT